MILSNNTKIKVLIVHARSGCCFWRAWQPTQVMKQKGLADVRYLETRTMTLPEINEGMKWADIICPRGLIGTDGLTLLRNYQKLGKKVAIDYDDLHFNVSPFNPAYRHFGLEDVTVKDPTTGDIKPLWEDGKDGLNIKANKVKFIAYQHILQEADLITCTTVYLKDAMAEISGRNDNIAVLPNAIDFRHWKPLHVRDKYKDEFRFGWAVSNSHAEDWLFIKPALIKFLETHPKAKFVCLGDTSVDITAVLPKDQVEWHPFSDLWEYHYPMRMAMLGLDVAIAPLADLEFNRCKSPLKYAEYTAFGWPVLAQDMLPYSECMIDGHNGLLAKSLDEWATKLDLLYKDKDLRAKLHWNALETVHQLFDLEKVSEDWYKIYKNCINEVVIA